MLTFDATSDANHQSFRLNHNLTLFVTPSVTPSSPAAPVSSYLTCQLLSTPRIFTPNVPPVLRPFLQLVIPILFKTRAPQNSSFLKLAKGQISQAFQSFQAWTLACQSLGCSYWSRHSTSVFPSTALKSNTSSSSNYCAARHPNPTEPTRMFH